MPKYLFTMPLKSNTVLVLDLDDTLYKEADYVRSGFKHVADLVEILIGHSVLNELMEYWGRNPGKDALGFACQLAGLPMSVKESLLWAYRLHSPDISLHPDVRNWLGVCQRECCAVAILSDGRSITQRMKLRALGLENIPAYISEEWSSEKPKHERFLEIQKRWQGKCYVYVGDNPAKDFLAPNQLHWNTIGLCGDVNNIHPQRVESCEVIENEKMYQPNFWVRDILEIDEVFFNKK